MKHQRAKNLLKYGKCRWDDCKNPAKPNQECCGVHQQSYEEVQSTLRIDRAYDYFASLSKEEQDKLTQGLGVFSVPDSFAEKGQPQPDE